MNLNTDSRFGKKIKLTVNNDLFVEDSVTLRRSEKKRKRVRLLRSSARKGSKTDPILLHFAWKRYFCKAKSAHLTPVIITLFMKRYAIHFSIYALHIYGSIEGVGGEGLTANGGGGEGGEDVC
jgi:hypothetical protein